MAAASPSGQDPISSESSPEQLLAAARDKLQQPETSDAMKELAEEIDDVRRRYLAERG